MKIKLQFLPVFVLLVSAFFHGPCFPRYYSSVKSSSACLYSEEYRRWQSRINPRNELSQQIKNQAELVKKRRESIEQNGGVDPLPLQMNTRYKMKLIKSYFFGGLSGLSGGVTSFLITNMATANNFDNSTFTLTLFGATLGAFATAVFHNQYASIENKPQQSRDSYLRGFLLGGVPSFLGCVWFNHRAGK